MKTLKRLKNRKIKSYCVVDTETWGLDGPLAFGVVYIDDDNKFSFKNSKEFYNIIIKNRIKLIYAHNLDFDAIKIREKTSVEGSFDQLFAGSQLLTFKEKFNNQIVEWRDSYALLKSSVNMLGKSLGLNKLETPDKYINPTKHTKIITGKDINYCIRDCKIVKIYLDKIFKISGRQELTIASTAMKFFRSEYLKTCKVHDLHINFKESYYGGRVECFKLGKVGGKEGCTVMDVNSLYPYVMKNAIFPDFGNLKSLCNTDIETAESLINSFEGMGTFVLYHPKTNIGLLPYRSEKLGKLIFPTGKFKGSYNFNELRFALKNGCKILKCEKIIYSPNKIDGFFKEYVEKLYKYKNESEGGERLIYKYLLNSLYGKFGENYHEKIKYCSDKELYPFIKAKKLKNHKIKSIKKDLNSVTYREENEKLPQHTIFSIVSYITSAARIELLKALINNPNAVYCDTDSIALESDTFNLDIGGNLGQWSEESYKIVKIFGNKFYKTNLELKLKGVPKSAVINGRAFNFNHFIKSKESLRRNIPVGSVINTNKRISLNYDKRERLSNNFTKPLNINEI